MLEHKLCELDIKDIQSKEAFFCGDVPVKRNRMNNLKSAHEFLDVLALIPLSYPIVFINSRTRTVFEIQDDSFCNFPIGKFFEIACNYEFDCMRQDIVNEKIFTKVYCIKREIDA